MYNDINERLMKINKENIDITYQYYICNWIFFLLQRNYAICFFMSDIVECYFNALRLNCITIKEIIVHER